MFVTSLCLIFILSFHFYSVGFCTIDYSVVGDETALPTAFKVDKGGAPPLLIADMIAKVMSIIQAGY